MHQILERYGIEPRHALGQNFLRDRDVLRRQIAYAELDGSETVLEIGPGIGNLTELLLQRAGKVIAVEKDRRFRRCLEELAVEYDRFEPLWGDALEVDLPPFDKVVANLPYGPALPITFRLLERRFDRAVLLYQKRLARRICADVGEQGYGRLSVSIGRIAHAELLEVVRPDAFYPEPEVDSALVLLRRLRPRFSVPDERFFRHLLEGLFARRQATLEEALRAFRDRRFTPPLLSRALSSLKGGIGGRSVYSLPPAEFGRIAWALWREMEAKEN